MKRKLFTFFTSALVPNFSCAARAHAYVGVAAQGTFFHVAVAYSGVEEDFFEPGEVLVGFVGGANIGLADDSTSGVPQRFRST